MKTVKDILAILLFLLIIAILCYFNGCNKAKVILTDTNKEKAAIIKSYAIIDSLILEVQKLKKIKQPIETRIKTRTVYITEKSDTVRKLIKDSTVLAYVDTLEAQVSDYDSLVIIQKAEILKLEDVIIQKDTIINSSNNIIAIIEQDNERFQYEIKKKKRKIKALKITAIAAPISTLLIFLALK
jgi:hypothetical protein